MAEETLAAKMSAKINPEKVHAKFSMTPYEKAIYNTNPSILSFSGRYILCFAILGIFLFFGYAEELFPKDPDNNFIENLLYNITIGGDISKLASFTMAMLFLTWANRFLNFDTSSKWYTTSMLMFAFIPLGWKMINFFVPLFGDDKTVAPLPVWSSGWYIVIGITVFVVMLSMTIHFNRSFKYAISDRTIYLKKDFLLSRTEHNIPLLDIDNLKYDVKWYARLMGPLSFGNVMMLTASGFGIKQESMGIQGGGIIDTAASAVDDVTGLRKWIKLFFALMTYQITRQEMDSDPEDCIYGVRRPHRMFRLVNELKEARRVADSSSHGAASVAADEVSTGAAVAESEAAPADEPATEVATE